MIQDNIVRVFTDGSCIKDNKGGYCAILCYKGKEKEIYEGYRSTTNNRMEALATIVALESLKRPCEVIITTDSQYVKNGITKWVSGWKKKGWKKANGDPVKNVDLWKRLILAEKPHHVTWEWVKGHSGHVQNERCDELARYAAVEKSFNVDYEYEKQINNGV